MKRIILMMVLTISVTIMPVKKAEAGVLLMGPTAGISVVLTVGGSYIGLDSLLMGCGGDPFCGAIKLMGFITGGVLVLLDEESDSNHESFNTVPEYVLDEINELALSKEDEAIELSKGIKEVKFTIEEVDEIFELLDERTTSEDKVELRSLLLESVTI